LGIFDKWGVRIFSVGSWNIDVLCPIKKFFYIITLISVKIRAVRETAGKSVADSFCDETEFAMKKIKKAKIERVW